MEKTPDVSSRIYWQMFITFVRIGAFTIGGGYAMIPLIQREVVQVRKWMSPKEFIDMLALAQSAPGVIAINTAIFIGYKLKGVRGSIVTALGCALPSFVIILLIAMVFTNFKDNPVVERIFKGIRPAVVALIAAPLYNMAKAAGVTWKTIFIPLIAALLIWGLNISPVWVVVAAIAGGIIVGILRTRNLKKTE
ncbi:MAG TPA: chromate transporter [Paludibacteraceae bacterium]|nr:chromate transporter [Paludibacteraceae bacterium]HPS10368.1 chromate transporter [Paludibacteraceae bacterium]